MQGKSAKARASAQILKNVEFGEEQELQGEMLEKYSEKSHSQQESDYLNPVYQAE